jgi:hypothetical protein
MPNLMRALYIKVEDTDGTEERVCKDQIIGSVTSGYDDRSKVVRDSENRILDRTSARFHTTRDSNGNLVSVDTADSGLLISRKNDG